MLLRPLIDAKTATSHFLFLCMIVAAKDNIQVVTMNMSPRDSNMGGPEDEIRQTSFAIYNIINFEITHGQI